MPQGYRKSLGAYGENAACAFLENQGYSIIGKNFFAGRSGELDIIAMNNNLIVFVEVKSRNSEKFGGGLYSITNSKIQKLRASAKVFLLRNPRFNSGEYTMRFDLIIVKKDGIEWVKDIVR